MKKCKYCNGKYKLIKKEHLVRTRNPHNAELIFEDLKTLVCTVCGYTMLPESSQLYVDSFREKIRRELTKESNDKKSDNTPQLVEKKEALNLTHFKEKLRKWIG